MDPDSNNFLKKINLLLTTLVDFTIYTHESEIIDYAILALAEMGYENVMISLLDKSEFPHVIKGNRAIGTEWEMIINETVRKYPGDDVLAKVLERKESKFIPDSFKDDEVNINAITVSKIKTQYIIPLWVDKYDIGTLQIHMNYTENKPEQECQLLDIIATYLSINVFQYRNIIRLREADSQILSFTKAAISNLFSSIILHQSYHEIRKINEQVDNILNIKQVQSIPVIRKQIYQLKDNLNQVYEKFESSLNFTKSNETKDEWNSCELIQETIDYWYEDAKAKGCLLTKNCDDSNCFIFVRKSSLKEALSCLIINSLQAHATKIIIKSEFSIENIGGRYKEECNIIRVIDNGIGIKRENIMNVFQAGFTTKIKEGTGLGLTIVQNLCDQMEGEVSLEKKGRNFGEKETVFKIIIPCTKQD